MRKSEYLELENVLHTFNPLKRALSRFLPKEWFVVKCKKCKQIPTEIISCYNSKSYDEPPRDNKRYNTNK